MPSIFVSYATADVEFVKAVIVHAEAAAHSGLKFFRANDPESLRPGDRWNDRILLEMDRADVAIFFVTPNSILKPWLNFELGYIAKSGTPLVCVTAKDLDKSISAPVSAYQLIPLNSVPKLAAAEILQFVAQHIPVSARRARPEAIQISEKAFPLDQGWQRYVFSGTQKTEMGRGSFGVTFGKIRDDDGFRFPASQDSLTAPWQFLALKANPDLPVSVYFVTEMSDRSTIKLYANSDQDSVGFGNPKDEFQIPVPRAGRSPLLLIKTASFVARLGRVPRAVKGLRVRGPTELGYIGMFESLASVPARFKRRDATRIAMP